MVRDSSHNQSNGYTLSVHTIGETSQVQIWEATTAGCDPIYHGCINGPWPDGLFTLEDSKGYEQLRASFEECKTAAQSQTWWVYDEGAA